MNRSGRSTALGAGDDTTGLVRVVFPGVGHDGVVGRAVDAQHVAQSSGSALRPATVEGPGSALARGGWRGGHRPIALRPVLVNLLIAAGVVVFPIPALVAGARGLLKHPGYRADEPADRASYVVLITLRALLLALVFALSAVILVSTIGATVKDVELHGLVYVFFVLDVLLALLIVMSFGRRDRRRVRRRVTPAGK